MGSNVVICAGPNHLGTRRADWSASSTYSSSFAVSNLKLPKPSARWRSLNLNPSNTTVEGVHTIPSFAGSYADSVGLVAHNLRQDSGRWRARLFASSSSAAGGSFEWIAPSGSSGASGVTGNHTDVDDDLGTDADDGNEIGPSGVGSWQITFQFPTPAELPVISSASDRRQAFVVKAYYANGTGANLDPSEVAAPTIQAYLLESGLVKRDLGMKRVTRGTDYQYLIWTWDASELSTASGANVELKLEGNLGANLGFGFTYAKVRAVSWRSEPASFTVQDAASKLIADTGWLTAVDDLVAGGPFGEFYPIRALRAETGFRRFADVGYTSDPPGVQQRTILVSLLLEDDQTPTKETTADVGRAPIKPVGYVEFGVPWLSKGLEVTVNREFGELVTFDDRSIRHETYGGNLGGAQLARRRIVSVPLENLTQAEAIALVDRLAWEGSILTPAMVSVRPEDELERRHTTIYGVLMDPMTALRAVNNNQTYNRGVTLRFLEWR